MVHPADGTGRPNGRPRRSRKTPPSVWCSAPPILRRDRSCSASSPTGAGDGSVPAPRTDRARAGCFRGRAIGPQQEPRLWKPWARTLRRLLPNQRHIIQSYAPGGVATSCHSQVTETLSTRGVDEASCSKRLPGHPGPCFRCSANAPMVVGNTERHPDSPGRVVSRGRRVSMTPCNGFPPTTQMSAPHSEALPNAAITAVFSFFRRVPMSSCLRRADRNTQPTPPSQTTPRSSSPPSDESSLPGEALLLLLPYRAPETVDQHPDVVAWRRRGWHVGNVEERLVEGKGTRLLITLHSAASPSADAASGDATGRNK